VNRIFKQTLLLLASFAMTGPVLAAKDVVVVAGATGRTGVHLVRELLAKGYEVRALVRDADKARTELPAGVQLFVGDVREPATLVAPMKGARYVISAIGAGGMKPEPGNGPQEVDFKGNVNLANAAKKAKVRQFVLVSSGATSKAETYPLAFMRPVLEAKFQSEEHLRKGRLPYTIVKPGGLIDEDGGKVGVSMSQGDTQVGRIPRADVATVAIAALGRRSALGKTFEVISGSEPPRDDWEKRFAALAPDPR